MALNMKKTRALHKAHWAAVWCSVGPLSDAVKAKCFRWRIVPWMNIYDFEVMIREIFDCVETSGDGDLSKEEFVQFGKYVLAATCSMQMPTKIPVNIDAMFEGFDEDGDGSLTWKEVWRAVNPLLVMVQARLF